MPYSYTVVTESVVVSTALDKSQQAVQRARHRPYLAAAAALLASYYLWQRYAYKPKDLTGKLFIVTGAAGSIGSALAAKLCEAGARVSLWDVNERQLEATASKLLQQYTPSQVHTMVVDVSKKNDIYKAYEQVRSELGVVYGVVNNAGIVNGKLFTELSDERIQKCIAINTFAAIWLTKAALPEMLNTGGHVVNMGSAAGMFGGPRLVDYCTSKFALLGFSDSLRAELMKLQSNVTVTVVSPAALSDSPLFTGYKNPLLTPKVSSDYVAAKTLWAIQADKNELYLPRMLYLAFVLRATLPQTLQIKVQQLLGVSSMMDAFSGTSGS